jgi:hypothetical protein
MGRKNGKKKMTFSQNTYRRSQNPLECPITSPNMPLYKIHPCLKPFGGRTW